MSQYQEYAPQVSKRHLVVLLAFAGASFILAAAGTGQFLTSWVTPLVGGNSLIATVIVALVQVGGFATCQTSSRIVQRLGLTQVVRWVTPVMLISGALLAFVFSGNAFLFGLSRLLVGGGGYLCLSSLAIVPLFTTTEESGRVTVQFQRTVVWVLPFIAAIASLVSLFSVDLARITLLVVLQIAAAIGLFAAMRGVPEVEVEQEEVSNVKPSRKGRFYAGAIGLLLELGGANALFYFGSTIFGAAFHGPVTKIVLNLTILLVNALATEWSIRWWNVADKPRKQVLLTGAIWMTLGMGVGAAALFIPAQFLLWRLILVGAGLAVFTWFRASTWGAVVFAMFPEFFPASTRARGVQEATAMDALGNTLLTIVSGVLAETPVYLFGFLTVMLVISIAYALKMPETVGLTDAQIEATFGGPRQGDRADDGDNDQDTFDNY